MLQSNSARYSDHLAAAEQKESVPHARRGAQPPGFTGSDLAPPAGWVFRQEDPKRRANMRDKQRLLTALDALTRERQTRKGEGTAR